ncbi:MAG: SHOCT domain-containing protein [Thermoproteota archaeon]
MRLAQFANSATISIMIIAFLLNVNFNFGLGIEKINAQENSTVVLDDVRNMLRNDRADISEVKNMTAREIAILSEINLTSTKLATQGVYTALSVFFLGIALVIFGLRLTTKGIAHMGKYFTMMVYALTIPVIILVTIFQVGIITNGPVRLVETEEPFFLLSFLMYIPIGIILFLLVQQKKIIHSPAVKAAEQTEKNLIQELGRISELRERGLITDEEFKKIKTELLSKL